MTTEIKETGVREDVKKLHLKYETLVNYAKERQQHHIEKYWENDKKYKDTGDVTYYQERENHAKMSSRLCSETIAYKKIRDELKEVLDHATVQ